MGDARGRCGHQAKRKIMNSLNAGVGLTLRAKPNARGANRVESLKAFMVAFKWADIYYDETQRRSVPTRRRERFRMAKRQVGFLKSTRARSVCMPRELGMVL